MARSLFLLTPLFFLLQCGELAMAQQINRRMVVDTLFESTKVNPEADKALLIVRSQICNLRFDSNRRVAKVNQVSSGYWEVWLPSGTHILKIDADGFERLDLAPSSFSKHRTYEMVVRQASGWLSVDVDESASLFIGDSRVQFSRNVPFKVDVGNHVVTIKKESYRDYSEKVLVSLGEAVIVRPLLERRTVRLSVNTSPSGADVFIDGLEQGPSPQTVSLEIGLHRVAVKKDGYEKEERHVRLEENQSNAAEVLFELKKVQGAVNVRSSDSDERMSPTEGGNSRSVEGDILKSSSILDVCLVGDVRSVRTPNDKEQSEFIGLDLGFASKHFKASGRYLPIQGHDGLSYYLNLSWIPTRISETVFPSIGAYIQNVEWKEVRQAQLVSFSQEPSGVLVDLTLGPVRLAYENSLHDPKNRSSALVVDLRFALFEKFILKPGVKRLELLSEEGSDIISISYFIRAGWAFEM